MPDEATTRWTVTAPKDTDIAVHWQVFDQALAEARESFADLAPDEQQALVDEATAAVRQNIEKLSS